MGRNSKLKFWGDNLVKGDNLWGMIESPPYAGEHNLTMAEVFQNEMWNWGATSFAFPTEVQERVRATPMQMYGDGRHFVVEVCHRMVILQ